jgi:GAF domain-containing protein
MHMSEEELAVRDDTSPVEDIRTWRQQLLGGVLRALVVLATVAIVPGSYSAYETQDTWLIPLYVTAYSIILVITFWRRISYTARAWAFLGVIYSMGVLELSDTGLGGEGRTYLLTLSVLAALFLGQRQGILALVLAAVTMVGFGWGYSTGHLVPTVELEEINVGPTWWLNSVVSVGMLGAILLISQNYLIPRLADALARSRDLAEELEIHRATLEEQVIERTAALARRSTQLEAAAQVAREAVAIRDVGRLLSETVRLISNRFGFYHAGIFMLDEAGQYAVLRAASSAGGQRMLARGHRLQVAQEGIVGYVTGQGHSRIALDVGADAVFFDNPDLPDTRSEMALPLQVRGEIIGALDVQSTEPAAFSDEDVAVLQTLADQLAMAISNTRLLEQVQESLEAERRAYGVVSRGAWSDLLHTQLALHQRYDPQGILPADGQWREEMQMAVQKGESVVGQEKPSITLATPIKVRDQVIGILDAHKPAGAGAWTAEEITLLETLADQLGVALESARLYRDAQRRATREQLIGEVTDRVRETLDIETMLKTGVQEVHQALGLPEVTVRLATRPVDETSDGDEQRAVDFRIVSGPRTGGSDA